MSIRIHELAKKIGMENKELLALLKEQGHDVKSVSSTISNIYAEEIEKKYAKPADASAAETAVETGAATATLTAPPPPATTTTLSPESGGAFTTRVPTGAFVKSAADVVREREEATKAAAAAARPAVVAPPPAPSAPRPAGPPPASVVSRPATVAPPAPPPRSASPAPLPPMPTAKAPASTPPPGVGSPRAPLAAAPSPAPLPSPAPVKSPGAPSLPAPLPSLSVRPASPTTPPFPARAASPTPPPALPATAPAGGPSASAAASGDVKIIHLKPPVVVRDFATAVGIKPFKLISELMEMGIFASMNQSIDEQVAVQIAGKHGFLLEIKHRGAAAAEPTQKEKPKAPEVDESKFLEPRPPVVCILGHVDHGKTTLLDAVRKANVAAGEAGGITQHIGAYQIEFNQRKITFLDTPGHAAFNKMRARGASLTDIAVLVVAADDGFMPQTEEALKHAQNAKVSLLVAINKMDAKGANLDRVKQQMQERGIAPEDWGGEVITVPVSAIKGQGIPELLEMILLQSDVLELKANPKTDAAGIVIESQIEVGRGSTATVIVQRGTLRVGDALVCGPNWTRVKALFDDQGRQLKEAPPSTPVKIIGWSGTPDSGATFKAVKNAREAERMAEEEQVRHRKEATTKAAVPKDVSVEKLLADIAASQQKTLRVVLKCDVFGSVEAAQHVLGTIKSSKVSLELVEAGVGLISKNDVLLAGASGAVIIGFNTKLEAGVTPLAKHHGVRIDTFEIIYELGDKVREMMADLLEPELKEVKQGAAEVRQVFPVSKGFVAGCLVTEGKITRNANARVRRGRDSVHEGKVGTLRRFKDDANEVRAGLECGIRLDGYDGYQPGDVIECFEVQKIRASL